MTASRSLRSADRCRMRRRSTAPRCRPARGARWRDRQTPASWRRRSRRSTCRRRPSSPTPAGGRACAAGTAPGPPRRLRPARASARSCLRASWCARARSGRRPPPRAGSRPSRGIRAGRRARRASAVRAPSAPAGRRPSPAARPRAARAATRPPAAASRGSTDLFRAASARAVRGSTPAPAAGAPRGAFPWHPSPGTRPLGCRGWMRPLRPRFPRRVRP